MAILELRDADKLEGKPSKLTLLRRSSLSWVLLFDSRFHQLPLLEAAESKHMYFTVLTLRYVSLSFQRDLSRR
jgi:hypothetical protein